MKIYDIISESKSTINFDIEDLKRLEKIKDLSTLKAQAFALISKPSERPMKPEKVAWFKSALEKMTSPMKVIKLMYDLLLSGEGHAVVGSKSSMNPNSYRQRFGEEQGVAEGGFSGSRAGYRPKADDERYPTTWANDANGKLIRVGDTIYFSSHGSLQPGIVQKIYWDDRWSDYGKPEQYLKLELENGETETKSPSWVVKNPPKDVAEGEYDDPRWEPGEPDMSRKVDWDIEAERNRPEEPESDTIVYIIDNKTNKVVLKFRSTGEYWGDIKHAAKHGYDEDDLRYDFKWKRKKIDETATAGATSAANVGTVVSPHLAIGKDRGNKSYTGSPGKSGTKAPNVPKTVQKKNPDGTAKNALDMSNNIFGGGAVKRS